MKLNEKKMKCLLELVSQRRGERKKPTQIENEVTIETKQKQWTEVLKLNGQKLTFRLDTGADCNLLQPFEKWLKRMLDYWRAASSW